MLTPRERVQAVLNHEQPDRVPLILGADSTTSMTMGAYRRLAQSLQIPISGSYLHGWPELDAAAMDDAVLVRLGSDARGVWDRLPEPVRRQNEARPPDQPFVDDWGVGYRAASSEGCYAARHPLAEAQTPADLDAYAGWPDMDAPGRWADVNARAAQLGADNHFAIIAAPYLIAPLERAAHLQGRAQLLKNMLRRPELVKALLARILAAYEAHLAHFLGALGPHVDLIVIGDDLGVQDGPLMSPHTYRTLLKPVHARLIATIKARAPARVLFHTDGDVTALLDDLVEIGVDVLGPVEPLALRDLPRLRRRYGARLCFCGAVDTLHVLPTGSPQDVRREVWRVIEALGPGYMAAATHTIMRDVPPANVLAMADAVRTYPG